VEDALSEVILSGTLKPGDTLVGEVNAAADGLTLAVR
jgi:hypothetical protein